MIAGCEHRLREHLRRIAVPRCPFRQPEAHASVKNYIKEQFLSYNFSVRTQDFVFQGRTFQNLIATMPEATLSAPRLIVGAHFDSVADTTGADDNASGAAALLEIARYVSLYSSRVISPSCCLELVAFDLEESDLIGSAAYARELKLKKQSVLGMLSLEMLGFISLEPGSQRYPSGLSWLYPDSGDFIALIGTITHPLFFWKVRNSFRSTPGLKTRSRIVPGKGQWVPDVRRSDHAPFWDEGFPAILVTDTSFFRNPHYHRPEDTLDTLNVPFTAAVTEAVVQAIQAFSS